MKEMANQSGANSGKGKFVLVMVIVSPGGSYSYF